MKRRYNRQSRSASGGAISAQDCPVTPFIRTSALVRRTRLQIGIAGLRLGLAHLGLRLQSIWSHDRYEITIIGDNTSVAGEFQRSEGSSKISRNQECGAPLLGSYHGDERVA